MVYIQIDNQITDDFVVYDEENNPITGLEKSDFTIELYNPSGQNVAGISINVTITEIGNGIYRVSYTPNTLGIWTLKISNSTYFEEGQVETYIAVESIDEVDEIAELKVLIKRVLGLSQENLSISNQKYDIRKNLIEATIKIYPSALDVENDTNPLAEYKMEATFDKQNRLTGYKYKKVG